MGTHTEGLNIIKANGQYAHPHQVIIRTFNHYNFREAQTPKIDLYLRGGNLKTKRLEARRIMAVLASLPWDPEPPSTRSLSSGCTRIQKQETYARKYSHAS